MTKIINNRFLVSAIWLLLLKFVVNCNRLSKVDDTSIYDEAWQAWKARHGKSYSSIDQESVKRRLWARKVAQVNAHNKTFVEGRVTYTKAVYEWADEDEERQLSRSCSDESIWQLVVSNWTEGDRLELDLLPNNKVPKSTDYRNFGFVSSVDHQKYCESCWAFAVVGSIEGLMAKTTGELQKLSTQQVVDCTGGDSGCSGGSPLHALQYALDNGLQTERSYPYKDLELLCKYDTVKVVFRFTGFEIKSNLSEKQLKAYVASVGPIATIIAITHSFMNYKGGIFSTNECDLQRQPNHVILIVGYGYEGAQSYWLLKNTHGIGWGEAGYMRFKRKIGLCRIGFESLWPVAGHGVSRPLR